MQAAEGQGTFACLDWYSGFLFSWEVTKTPEVVAGFDDTAVFQAFKEVEVRVRDVGKFSATDIGTDLMRKAFHPDTGPLTDTAAVPAERQALMLLFSGAIGSYKNPSSHRHIGIEPDEAVEMIVLASHLLRIADSRA